MELGHAEFGQFACKVGIQLATDLAKETVVTRPVQVWRHGPAAARETQVVERLFVTCHQQRADRTVVVAVAKWLAHTAVCRAGRVLFSVSQKQRAEPGTGSLVPVAATRDNSTMSIPDYNTLIDTETWQFIRDTGQHYPTDAATLDIASQRKAYDALCAAFRQARPDTVISTDVDAECDGLTVPVRVYRSTVFAPAAVLYLHGGGFVVGGLDSHDDVCAELANRTGLAVVAVDYRLAPEHVHPAAFADALAAYRWTFNHVDGRVILAGDSAGGCLAAALAQVLRGAQRPLGQVLIYPGLGGDVDAGSYLEHASAPMLTREDVLNYHRIYGGERDHSADPTFAPLAAADFSNLPPTVAISADCDPLRDDARDYCERVNRAGGKADWVNEPGLVHGYLRARHRVQRARASFDRIVESIQSCVPKDEALAAESALGKASGVVL